MAEIVKSLFGIDPYTLQQQRNARYATEAEGLFGGSTAISKPFDIANRAIYQGAAQATMPVAGMLGARDVQMEEAQASQDLLSTLDLSTSKGVLAGIEKARAANMPQQAAILAQRYNELKDAETKRAYEQAATAKALINPTKTSYEPDPTDASKIIKVTETWNPVTMKYDREESASGFKFNPKSGFGGNRAAELLTEEELNFMARQYLSGDRQVLTGFGRSPEALAKLKVAVVRNAKEMGITAEQLPSILAEYKGYEAGAKATSTAQAKMTQAAMETNSLIDIAKTVVADVKPGQYPGMNTVSNFLSYQGGDPNIVRLKNAFNGIVNTYARAISPTGQPTVSDKDHAREVLDTAFSSGQLQGAFDMMKQEMNAAISAPKEARKELTRQRMQQVAPNQVESKPVAKWGRDASGKPVRLK